MVSGEILEHCSDTVSPAGEIETVSLHVLRKDRLGKGESQKNQSHLAGVKRVQQICRGGRSRRTEMEGRGNNVESNCKDDE